MTTPPSLYIHERGGFEGVWVCKIDDLETLPIGNLIREVDILKINAEMHPLELDSYE